MFIQQDWKKLIIFNFLELCASKSGCDIVLVMNREVGSDLRKACERDAEDDACIFDHAANTVRK